MRASSLRAAGWRRLRDAYLYDPSRTLEELCADWEIEDPQTVYARAKAEEWPRLRNEWWRDLHDDAATTVRRRVVERAVRGLEEVVDLATEFVAGELRRAIEDGQDDSAKPVRRTMRRKQDDAVIEVEMRTRLVTATERRALLSEACSILRTLAGIASDQRPEIRDEARQRLELLTDLARREEELDQRLIALVEQDVIGADGEHSGNGRAKD